MIGQSKHSQLQVRVSVAEKRAIRGAADRAGMDMSAYVLARLLPVPARDFLEWVESLSKYGQASFALAGLNSLLSKLSASELRDTISARPPCALSPFLANYLAAMVETACASSAIQVPSWVRAIPPLTSPFFGSSLRSLRFHLLTHSPPAFRRRNLFIDSTLGDQV